MNRIGLTTLILKELRRTVDVILQSVLTPVITTVLYFIVFGAALGSHISLRDGIPYAQFIVPGLMMMAIIPNALGASASGIYFQKYTGAIVFLLTSPMGAFEIATGYVVAAAIRGLIIGGAVFGTAALVTDITLAHPLLAIMLLTCIATTFALMGLIVGLWADDFERLTLIPMIILTPATFLGGVFYSIDMLPSLWQHLTQLNPFYYMIDALRWCFFDISHTDPRISLAFIGVLCILSVAIVGILFRTGYRIKP